MLPDLAAWAAEVDRADTYRAVVSHPLVKSGFDVRGSIQIPDVPAIRALAATLFPPAGTLPDSATRVPEPLPGKPTASGVAGCAPAPAPPPSLAAADADRLPSASTDRLPARPRILPPEPERSGSGRDR